MDFLVSVFWSAFSGHAFLVIIFLVACTQAVFLLAALVDLSDKEQTPRWALVSIMVIPLLLGALGFGLYLTS